MPVVLSHVILMIYFFLRHSFLFVSALLSQSFPWPVVVLPPVVFPWPRCSRSLVLFLHNFIPVSHFTCHLLDGNFQTDLSSLLLFCNSRPKSSNILIPNGSFQCMPQQAPKSNISRCKIIISSLPTRVLVQASWLHSLDYDGSFQSGLPPLESIHSPQAILKAQES